MEEAKPVDSTGGSLFGDDAKEKKVEDKKNDKRDDANVNETGEGEWDPNATPPNPVEHPSGGIPLEGDWKN